MKSVFLFHLMKEKGLSDLLIIWDEKENQLVHKKLDS
jgi:hypothetical protein